LARSRSKSLKVNIDEDKGTSKKQMTNDFGAVIEKNEEALSPINQKDTIKVEAFNDSSSYSVSA
jgi:hypothetical protein